MRAGPGLPPASGLMGRKPYEWPGDSMDQPVSESARPRLSCLHLAGAQRMRPATGSGRRTADSGRGRLFMACSSFDIKRSRASPCGRGEADDVPSRYLYQKSRGNEARACAANVPHPRFCAPGCLAAADSGGLICKKMIAMQPRCKTIHMMNVSAPFNGSRLSKG